MLRTTIAAVMETLLQWGKNGARLLFGGFTWPSTWAESGNKSQGRGNPRLPVCSPEGMLPIYTSAQGGEFMFEEGRINPRQSVGRCRHGKWVSQIHVASFRISTSCVSEASIASCSSRGIRVARVLSSPGVAPEESAVYCL